jgi:predicted nicotinamide N-methyase
MVDAEAEELEISICERDFTIKQSPGLLRSNRAGGTTAAAVWRICVHFSEWLGSTTNPLFQDGILDANSTVIELGSGISGLVPSMLAPRVGRVLATDQPYALKLLQDNIHSNQAKPSARKASHKTSESQQAVNNIDGLSLDWEEDDVHSFLRSNSLERGVDAVVVCDCVFNYALIQPLMQTCNEICKARSTHERTTGQTVRPTLCIIAQQLRQPDVFESWLRSFLGVFRVWRLPDSKLTQALRESSGFVVHVGVLRTK